jgi:hypothetical protein
MKASTVLKKAKQYLAMNEEDRKRSYDGWGEFKRYYYICWAIDEANCPTYDKIRVKEYISGLLGVNSTLEGWLDRTRHFVGNPHKPANRIKLQRTRLAWMDWMIEQFEAKGD